MIKFLLFGYFISFLIGFPIVILFILLFIDKFSNNKFFCNTMGWHKSPSEITNDGCSNDGCSNDGCSNEGICSRYGDKVLQDSNEDWF